MTSHAISASVILPCSRVFFQVRQRPRFAFFCLWSGRWPAVVLTPAVREQPGVFAGCASSGSRSTCLLGFHNNSKSHSAGWDCSPEPHDARARLRVLRRMLPSNDGDRFTENISSLLLLIFRLRCKQTLSTLM